MKAVIAITPMQFLLGIALLVALPFILLFYVSDVITRKTTPEEVKYTQAIVAPLKGYISLRDQVTQLETNNQRAVIRKDISRVKITPMDWRILGGGDITLKNITDVDVGGVNMIVFLESPSLEPYKVKLLPLKFFENPVKPNETVSFEYRFNSLALSSLEFEKGDVPPKIKDYVGTHEISKVSVIVKEFTLSDKPQYSVAVAPAGRKTEDLEKFQSSVRDCRAYFDSLIDRFQSGPNFALSEIDLESNRVCLDKIIANSPRGIH